MCEIQRPQSDQRLKYDLVLGGIDNASKRAALVVLDPGRFGGASLEE
jgi:hypothetical protein